MPSLTQEEQRKSSSGASLSVGKAVFQLDGGLLTGQDSPDGICPAPSEPSRVHGTEQQWPTTCFLSVTLRTDLAGALQRCSDQRWRRMLWPHRIQGSQNEKAAH